MSDYPVTVNYGFPLERKGNPPAHTLRVDDNFSETTLGEAVDEELGRVEASVGKTGIGGIVRQAVPQTFSTSSLDKVVLGTVEFDPFNLWDSGNNDFVVPFAGLWIASGRIYFEGDSGGRRECIVRVNDVSQFQDVLVPASDSVIYGRVSISNHIYLQANDRVALWARQSSGANLDTRIENNLTSHLGISLVSSE